MLSHFLYKSFTFYYFTYTVKFFCDNYFLYKSLSSLTSYPRESFISLFSELFSPLVLFCFLSNFTSPLSPFQMELVGFFFVFSLLLVRESSPFCRHVLNWFNEGYSFCSSRTLIILYPLEAINKKCTLFHFAFSLNNKFLIFSITIIKVFFIWYFPSRFFFGSKNYHSLLFS